MAPPSDINHPSHPCIYGDFASSYSERKSGFMKWFGKIFKIGSSRGRGGGRHLQQPVEENMAWRALPRSLDERARSKKEEEDLNNATALSLREDLKRPTGYGWRTGTDDDYAKALQGRLHSSLPPPYAPIPFYPRGYGIPSHIRICAGCNQEILYGNCLRFEHVYFHPYCFRCHSCHHRITECEFNLSGNHPYHKSCFKELTHPKCEVCHHDIPVNSAGLIEYRCHPYWNQKYCPSHE